MINYGHRVIRYQLRRFTRHWVLMLLSDPACKRQTILTTVHSIGWIPLFLCNQLGSNSSSRCLLKGTLPHLMQVRVWIPYCFGFLLCSHVGIWRQWSSAAYLCKMIKHLKAKVEAIISTCQCYSSSDTAHHRPRTCRQTGHHSESKKEKPPTHSLYLHFQPRRIIPRAVRGRRYHEAGCLQTLLLFSLRLLLSQHSLFFGTWIAMLQFWCLKHRIHPNVFKS